MVIVVPALAHGDECCEWDIEALHGCASDIVEALAPIVGEPLDQPVTENTG